MMLFRRFIKSKHGGVLIFMALAFGMLVAAVGIAIDMGRVFLVRAKAQTALDSAVISAAAISNEGTSASDLQQRGVAYFNANFPDNLMGVASVSPTFSAVNNGASVRGDLSFEMNTLFGPIIDVLLPRSSAISDVELGLFSQVNRVMSDMDLEVALVLDFTTSMCFASGTTEYNVSTCDKYDGMVSSVKLFTNTIDSNVVSSVGNGKVYYSFIPFAHTVRINNSIKHDDENRLLSLPNIHGLREGGEKNGGRDIVSILEGRIPGRYGNTNTAVGSSWGWKSLRASSSGEFIGLSKHEGGDHPAPFGDVNTFRMMLLLTDGKNTFLNTSWDNVDFLLANEQQKEICALAQDEGIQIRVIPFQVADADTKNMLKDDCASEPEYYYEANNVDELKFAFEEIANDLIDLRISK